jgi:hypothetical protein
MFLQKFLFPENIFLKSEMHIKLESVLNSE